MDNYINQSNKKGDNIVQIIGEIDLKIDIGWLHSILYNHPKKVKKLLQILSGENKKLSKRKRWEIPETIEDKNRKNKIETFFEKYIKPYESKLNIMKEFFDNNEDIWDDVFAAAESIGMAILGYWENSEKLTPKIMNELIVKHTENLEEIEDKQLMKMIIFFLYRFCFIGEK